MNIHKHMEAIFVVALVAVGVGTFAYDSLPQANAVGSAAKSAAVTRDAVSDARAIVVRAPTMPRRA
ncbi:hypothetical protein [Massilia sp. Leaf139]|uniref:hypothetical protein n=1 Tax=Massilia sp. Leaf139 TaxID=1736272 RepID=UPI0006F32BDA|nr:hypothetical protein [Massilia sp. Leaf139]KQQ97187.1 hypothetical protein ASF77_04300 [Massilia sp. Leaf139]